MFPASVMDRDELVRLAGERLADSIFREAPTDLEWLKTRTCGRIEQTQVRFFVYEDVLEELAFAAGYRRAPSAAILLGAFAVDDEGPFLEVTGFSHLSYLSQLDDLYDQLRSDVDDLADELSNSARDEHIVGLFVGAADSGGRLPPQVARTHLSLFNVPYQLAAVYDPQTHQFGLHARPPAGSFFNSPFWLVERLE